MKRSAFLKRSGAVLGGLVVAGRLPAAPVEAAVTAPEALPVAAMAPGLPTSLVATGGLCAPLAPYYDLMPLTMSADRPVRDALPPLTTSRGGIRFKGAE